MAPAAALDNLYATEADVQAFASTDGESLRLTDQGEVSPTVTELAYLTTNGLSYATARINLYCLGKYDSSELAKSWLVNEWCVIITCRWLCQRRFNPVPESLQKQYEETIKLLEQVQAGVYQLTDIGQRNASGPTWSNVIVRPEYEMRKVRVERPISGRDSVSYPQQIDYQSERNYFEI